METQTHMFPGRRGRGLLGLGICQRQKGKYSLKILFLCKQPGEHFNNCRCWLLASSHWNGKRLGVTKQTKHQRKHLDPTLECAENCCAYPTVFLHNNSVKYGIEAQKIFFHRSSPRNDTQAQDFNFFPNFNHTSWSCLWYEISPQTLQKSTRQTVKILFILRTSESVLKGNYLLLSTSYMSFQKRSITHTQMHVYSF